MPSRTTKPSTPRLSELARHVVVPAGVATTGWPAVEAKCADLGVRFRPWQPPVGRLILAKRKNGKYAATIGGTGLSIPRQVGKTFLVGAIVFALCLLFPNLTVIWTSHRLRTAEETFKKMLGFSRRKRIDPHIEKRVLGSGEEEIRFRNGSRILFGARERGFGRGFDEVDVLIFDEAQILSDAALDDMVPATNQSRQPAGALLLFMGTPPKPTDPGEVFTRMRTEALGDDTDTGWVEFGADAGYIPTAKPAPLTAEDWRQVGKANPSYPRDTPRESILRMRKQLTVESFPREGLGIWDGHGSGALDDRLWLDAVDTKAERGKNPSFGVDIAEDRLAHIAVAWHRPDGGVQVMLADSGLSPLQLEDRTKALRTRWGGGTYTGGTASDLDGAETVNGAEFAAACGRLADLLEEKKLHHGNQPELNSAVESARWRNYGSDGARAFRLKDAPEVGPLAAVVRALHGLFDVRPSDFYTI